MRCFATGAARAAFLAVGLAFWTGSAAAEGVSTDRTANEVAAVAALRMYLGTQNQFHRADFYGKGMLVYANPRDGAGFPDLYRAPNGTTLKLVDFAFARAASPLCPRAGYYFVDITSDAKGKEYDFSIDCGLCAVPAEYGVTGKNTFVIDVTGGVYQKDGGGRSVRRYPDVEKEGWARVGQDLIAAGRRRQRLAGSGDSRDWNESAAAGLLRLYLAAQLQFHRTDWHGKGMLVYANPRDGAGFPDLYRLPNGTTLRLIDLAFACAASPLSPRAGYYFVDITRDAKGREYDFSINCGLCAVPAEYGVTGKHTFIIDVTGVVYQKDNGGRRVTVYPDVAKGWVPVGSELRRSRQRRPPVLFRSRLKTKSATNLKQFGYGCHLWAADHDEEFPPSFEALYERQYLKDRKVLECPARPGEPGYVYVKGLKAADPPWVVLAYEKDGCFRDGRNALFIGGNVQWMSEAKFQEALTKTGVYMRDTGRGVPSGQREEQELF